MKVTKESTFDPITIVIESQQEADILWHRLNISRCESISEYSKNRGWSENDSMVTKMWNELNKNM